MEKDRKLTDGAAFASNLSNTLKGGLPTSKEVNDSNGKFDSDDLRSALFIYAFLIYLLAHFFKNDLYIIDDTFLAHFIVVNRFEVLKDRRFKS